MQEERAKRPTFLVGADARRALLAGVRVAAEVVGCTLGPRGKNVLIKGRGKKLVLTKDGVTVSRSIRLSDPFEQLGVELVVEAASHTNDNVGDGTTTATILTHAMVSDGMRLLEAGFSAQGLVRGIDSAIAAIRYELRTNAQEAKTFEKLAQVATVSANGDREIGDIVARALSSSGEDGIVTIDDAKGTVTQLDRVDGMQVDRGYLSPYFVTDNEKMLASHRDAMVLVTDRRVSSLRDLVPVLERVLGAQRPLLIIAGDVEGEALHGLVLNRVKQNIPVVAIRAPGRGNHGDDLLRDICVMTGAKLSSEKTGLKLADVALGDLGKCKSVAVDARTTVLVGDSSTKLALEEHLVTLRAQSSDVTLEREARELLRNRIARLAGGVSVIRVGGLTELEATEKRHRIEDAVNAARAASVEGIVSGGGSALLYASMAIVMPEETLLSADEKLGWKLVVDACSEPLRKIASNAGESPDVIVDKMKRQSEIGTFERPCFDAKLRRVCDALESGIIDPVIVTGTALERAASVASSFLMTDALVLDDDAAPIDLVGT